MSHWQRFTQAWGRFWRVYRRVCVRPELVRTDPFTILTVIGVISAVMGMSVGAGAVSQAEDAAAQLANAPDQWRAQLAQQMKDGKISPYAYNARLEQVSQLEGIFDQYRAIYQQRGNQLLESGMLDGMVSGLLALIPGSPRGQRAVARYAIGTNNMITLNGIRQGVEGDWKDLARSISAGPFADLERQLADEISAIMGSDLEPFFAARMRGKVNELKNAYLDQLLEHPDDAAAATDAYYRLLDQRAAHMANVLDLVGGDSPWSSEDAFRDWLDALTKKTMIAEGITPPGDRPTAPEPDTSDSGNDTTLAAAPYTGTLAFASGSAPGEYDERIDHSSISLTIPEDGGRVTGSLSFTVSQMFDPSCAERDVITAAITNFQGTYNQAAGTITGTFEGQITGKPFLMDNGCQIGELQTIPIGASEWSATVSKNGISGEIAIAWREGEEPFPIFTFKLDAPR